MRRTKLLIGMILLFVLLFTAGCNKEESLEVNRVDEETQTLKDCEVTESTEEITEETTIPVTEAVVNIQEVNETVYAAWNVNIREGYGTGYKILSSLKLGQSIVRTGICDNGWSRVSYNNQTAYILTKYLSTKKTTVTAATSDQTSITSGESTRLNVNSILQNPELPTGCEITSLTVVLNYLGYSVDKAYLSDNFLDKYTAGTVSAWNGFIGNPRTAGAYGCFAPPIIKAANSYLASAGGSEKAINLTGSDISIIYNMVQNGHPIIVWATIGMVEPFDSTTWNINGENFTWPGNEHCLVLIGYTDTTVTFADPLKGIVTYSRTLFEKRYKQLYSQAIAIY